MLQAFVGYATIVVMLFLILNKKASAAFCFSILPVIGAAICGFGFADIVGFIDTGMGSVWKTALLFIFSVSFFSTMSEAGLFDPLVNGLVKMAGSNIILIMVATSLIAVVAHMDGACASTYLITIPVMLPIFKRMKLNPLILLLLVGLSTGIMNLVPWGGSDHSCRYSDRNGCQRIVGQHDPDADFRFGGRCWSSRNLRYH